MDSSSVVPPYTALHHSAQHLNNATTGRMNQQVKNDAKKSRKRELESKLSSLLSAVIDVKREMNSLQPVSSIPQELLVEIFYQLGQLTTRRFGSYEWAVVGRVCHYWRETALQHSRLWDHLVFKVEDTYFVKHALKEVLDRSGQAPLVVEMKGTGNARKAKYVRAIRAVLKHISHIQSLTLTIPGWIDEEVLTPGIAHLLEEVDVTMETTSDSTPDSEDPDLFPGCQFPALQRVTANGVPYRAIHPLISSQMTEIWLFRCSLNESESLLFIDILSTLHNLDTLALFFVTWTHSGAMLTPRAVLHRLRLLRIYDNNVSNTSHFQILDYLEISPNTNLQIYLSDSYMHPSAMVPVFVECIANLVRKSSIGVINPLLTACFHRARGGVNVAAWPQIIEIEDLPLSDYVRNLDPQVDVGIYAEVTAGRRYAGLVRALCCTEVQIVTMHGIEFIEDIPAWLECFSMLTKVRVLRVSGTDTVFSDVYRLWTAATLDKSTIDAEIDIFPSLEKLELLCRNSISGEEDILGLLETKGYEVSPIVIKSEDESFTFRVSHDPESWRGYRAVRVG